MTTYYHYDSDGTVTASKLHPKAAVFTPSHPDAEAYERNGDVVGAYLARRDKGNPAHGTSEAHQSCSPTRYPLVKPFNGSIDGQMANQIYKPSDGDELSGYNTSPVEAFSTLGWVGWAAYSGMERPYPNPEDIRHLHTLQSLLPYLQPERKMNALNGPVLDIVEQDTGVTLAYQVPKKMLVLFLGRKVVNKFIRTTHREDDVNWKGAPVCQEMDLPRGVASKAAMKALIAWMLRACNYQTMSSMKQIRVPKNTFVACSLARTMELFDLHKDALRVDHYIAECHLARPIFAVELGTLWNCLGKNSRYTYAAIKAVGQRLREFEADSEGQEIPGIDEDMLAMLREYPDLEARVRDPEVNEQHRPVFNTNWIKRIGDKNDHSREGCGKQLKKKSFKPAARRLEKHQPIAEPTVSPQLPASPESMVRKFAVLRIVAEDTRASSSDAQSSAEPDESVKKP
ncbi:hypothetical protein J4E90_007846 [Alternaria incomplexa]|uniref:uncharacterized protein n=1 Tax=Alternaria incomplexa TaxID=1187928 RepID=UPI00221F7949|nr:uncharacterized protein J4E90_007846 [Alternaria incomplexa]KAI4910411.1 hypothetical protein J4E90_007846 [Alternaria incomplexa]